MHTENKTAREVLAESDWAAENAASSPSTSIQHTASMNTGSQTFPSDKPSGVAPSLPARPSNTVPSLPARPATPNKTPSTAPVIPPKPAIATSSHSPSTYVNSRTGYIPKRLNLQMNSDLCAKCDKPVYAAELVHGASKKYHKMCFRCFNCNRQLDSTNMVDKNFEVYCRPCYSKEFGPKVICDALVKAPILYTSMFNIYFNIGLWIWRSAIYRRSYAVKACIFLWSKIKNKSCSQGVKEALVVLGYDGNRTEDSAFSFLSGPMLCNAGYFVWHYVWLRLLQCIHIRWEYVSIKVWWIAAMALHAT